jgi:hypothetical protein
MTRERQPDGGLSVLSLHVDVIESGPDWPVVTIRVDGQDPFSGVARDWRGFDPAEMLGTGSPMLPDDLGRRVALYRCSCGVAGCGVIAPFIVPSPDGARVSWVDFRDYVGVFDGPTAAGSAERTGKPWSLPDLHFDRAQYEAEVLRAGADTSWETPRRRMARLVEQQLRELDFELPDLALRWVVPAWHGDGVNLSFERVQEVPERYIEQKILRVRSNHADAVLAANDIVDQLVGTPPEERFRVFGEAS